MIKGITFDFWGTLVKFKGGEIFSELRFTRAKEFKKEIEKKGYKIDLPKVLTALDTIKEECSRFRESTYKEITAKEVIKLIVKELNLKEDGELEERLGEIYSNTIFSIVVGLYDGVKHVMNWCRKNKLKVGLLSNTEHGSVELSLLEKFGISHYFDGIVFSSEVGVRKPNRGIFYYIIEKLAVSPKEMVHVGDWPEIDVVGAKGVGMRAIFFNSGKITYPKGLILPDAVVEEFEEIPEIVENF